MRINFGRFSRNARLFMCGTFFVGFGFGTFWVLLNLYFKEMGLGEAMIGRIITWAATGTFLVALPAAFLIDRFPTKAVLLAAAGMAFLGYGGQASPLPLPVVMAASVLAGAAFAVHNIAAAPFFMRNSTPAERLDLFGMNAAVEILAGVAGAAGGGAVPGLVTALGGTLLAGYRVALLTSAVMVLLGIVPYLLIHEERRPVDRRPLTRYVTARDWGLLRRLMLPKFLVGLGAGLIIPFLNLYFRNRFSLASDTIGLVFAVSQILTMFGFLAGPHLARRMGMIRAAVTTELLSIPFFLTLAFTHAAGVAVAAFWLRGALMNMNQPISDNFAMEMVTTDQHAITNSLNSMVWNGAWMISAQLGGALIEAHGFALPILVTVTLYLGSSVLYLFFFHRAEKDVIEPRRRREELTA